MADGLHVVCPHCRQVNRVPAEKLEAGGKCGACHEPLFTGHPAELDARALEQHIRGNDIPLVVDFWAPWCAPCRMMAPAFERVTRRLEPRLRFAKLDTEAHPRAAVPYAIRGIPTLILFQGGKERDRISGALDERSLEAWIAQRL